MKSLIEKYPGSILVEGKPYTVPDSAHEFVLILIDYCQLVSIVRSNPSHSNKEWSATFYGSAYNDYTVQKNIVHDAKGQFTEEFHDFV